MSRLRSIYVLVCGLLPAWRLKNRLLALAFGRGSIHPDVRIHPVLLLGVRHLQLAAGVRIGFANTFRMMDRIELGEATVVGQFNWVSASIAFEGATPEWATLRVGRHSAITSRHYIDCTGGVTVGDFSLISGIRTTIMSHGIDVGDNVQRPSAVTIGDYCLVGSNSALCPGLSMPDRTQVAMGSLLAGTLDTGGLWCGHLASHKRHVSGQFFEREVGWTHVAAPDARSEPVA